MSASPPKDAEAETEVLQSPDDAENKQEGNENMTGLGPEAGLYDTEVKEQDRWLPIANVARIMKTALPENAKIAKEAKECMQECVSEFISFITSEASEKCQQEKRKTVNGEDILFAMASLGFENYGEALKIYLARYRETQVAKTDNSQNRTQGGFGSSGDVVGAEDEPAIPTANAVGAVPGSGAVDGAATGFAGAASAPPTMEPVANEGAGFNSY